MAADLETILRKKFNYLDLQAYLGYTKHYGGIDSTIDLANKCHISKGSYVLDVGCGVGATTCWLAKRYGCKVVGIDVSEHMIQRAQERMRRMGLEGSVEFRVADAQKLPFKSNTFDAAIAESVLMLVPDRKKALKECIRAVKPGGFVGVNEPIWNAPPKKMVEYTREVVVVDLWDFESLSKLFKSSGLKDVQADQRRTTLAGELRGMLARLGILNFPGAAYRALRLYLTNPAFRKYIKEALAGSKGFSGYARYGIFVGRK